MIQGGNAILKGGMRITCMEPGIHIQTHRQTHVRRKPGNRGGMDVCIEYTVNRVSRSVDGNESTLP